MIQWESGHASPDVHAGAWVRLNFAWSEPGECTLVGDQRNRRGVLQEKIQFPRKANGHHSLGPTEDLQEVKRSAHYHLNNRKRDTVVARRTVIISVRRGLWVLSRLLGMMQVGVMMITGLMVLGLVLPGVHGGAAKKELGIIILWTLYI